MISAKSLGRYNHNPRIVAQRLENVSLCLRFIAAEGLKLVNIGATTSTPSQPVHRRLIYVGFDDHNLFVSFEVAGPEDIVDSKAPKLILGLIWTLILRYQIKVSTGDDSAKNALLEWVRSKIPEYDIKNFTKGTRMTKRSLPFSSRH